MESITPGTDGKADSVRIGRKTYDLGYYKRLGAEHRRAGSAGIPAKRFGREAFAEAEFAEAYAEGYKHPEAFPPFRVPQTSHPGLPEGGGTLLDRRWEAVLTGREDPAPYIRPREPLPADIAELKAGKTERKGRFRRPPTLDGYVCDRCGTRGLASRKERLPACSGILTGGYVCGTGPRMNRWADEEADFPPGRYPKAPSDFRTTPTKAGKADIRPPTASVADSRPSDTPIAETATTRPETAPTEEGFRNTAEAYRRQAEWLMNIPDIPGPEYDRLLAEAVAAGTEAGSGTTGRPEAELPVAEAQPQAEAEAAATIGQEAQPEADIPCGTEHSAQPEDDEAEAEDTEGCGLCGTARTGSVCLDCALRVEAEAQAEEDGPATGRDTQPVTAAPTEAEAEEAAADWDIWADIYEAGRERPDGYSAERVRNRILSALPDARVFPIDYRPGRKVRGELSELDRPTGWQTTTPGGFEVDIPKFRKAALAGWVLDRWEVLDVDEPVKAAAYGITPAVLTEAGGMIVLTPSGGCHAIFAPSADGGKRKGRTIRPGGDECGYDWLTGKSYIYAPHSWRPEHHQNGRVKPAGLYLPIWDKFAPVPCPAWLYALIFPAKPSSEGRRYDPKTAEDNRPQWAVLQDAAVRLRQAFPDITAEAAADILWERHIKRGFLPNLNPAWPWTLAEMTGRIRSAWRNRDNWEAEQAAPNDRPLQSGKPAARRGRNNAPPTWADGWE